MIALDKVSKRYGAIQALSDLSLTVERGEMFGLIGPDGAGKTTTIRTICGLQRPDRGSVRVLDLDPSRDHRAITDSVGYLSQHFSLYGDLSIDENIAFFAEIHGVRDYAAARDRLLELTGLAPFRGRLAQQLSGGMKQKLALACTLVHEPALILLDEPTTGVDPVSRREFWKLLAEFLSRGVTIVMATPYLDEAERCSRVALLHEGRLLALDRPDALRSQLPGRVAEVVVARQAAGGGAAGDDAGRARRADVRRARPCPVRPGGDRNPRRLVGAAPRRRRIRGKHPADSPIAGGRVHRAAGRGEIMKSAALVGLLLVAESALAQPDQRETAIVLTLDDAIDRGVRASARLREAGARTEMASAVAEQRRAASQPQVTVQAGYMRTNHVSPFVLPVPGATGPIQPIYPDVPDNYRSRLDLQYPLYNSGRFTALEQAARSESAAADADERTARADLRSRSRAPTGPSSPRSNSCGVVEQSIAATRAHLENARRRLEAGIVAPHDVLAIEAQESRQQLLAIQARGNRDVAEADLARLIGVAASAHSARVAARTAGARRPQASTR